MRRFIRHLLPLIALALIVQIIAPVGACWAASIALADPLHDAAICSGVADGSASDRADQGARHKRDGCAAACSLAQPATLDGSVPPVRPIFREAYRVAWRAFQPDAVAARLASAAQARAPPHAS